MNEIINFPKDRIIRESPNLTEELAKAKQKGVKNFCDQLTEEMIIIMLDVLDNSGIETDTDTFQKDIALTIDSLRATLYRSMGLPHHLHDFIDNNLTVMTSEEAEAEQAEGDNDDIGGKE